MKNHMGEIHLMGFFFPVGVKIPFNEKQEKISFLYWKWEEISQTKDKVGVFRPLILLIK